MIRLSLNSCCRFVSAVLVGVTASADPFDAPTGYYDSATGTGVTLQNQLHNIIDNHRVQSYNAARSALQVTDEDPDDGRRMLLVYSRESLDVSRINGSPPGWDSGRSWDREHTWPRSRGVDSSGPDNSDLHQLRPSDPQLNSRRGNLNFGGAFGANGGNTGRLSDGGDVWYPGNEDAGMIARQMFYMDVRYDGSDSNTQNLRLVNGNPALGGATLGNLDRLIQWHYEAAPDRFERRRNDVIFDDYQGNRNPFIDRPQLAWSVFVDQRNDSRISVAGGVTSADGGSTLEVDLGRVFVGSGAGDPRDYAQQERQRRDVLFGDGGRSRHRGTAGARAGLQQSRDRRGDAAGGPGRRFVVGRGV